MVLPCQFNQLPVKGTVITRSLPNGGQLVFTETERIQAFCKIAYDVDYNQQRIGYLLVIDIDPDTRQEIWKASFDGLNWSPDLSSQNAALELLMSAPASC